MIFDEIQNCPRALTSLKYFCEDLPELAICAAGSLLGVAFSDESFPMGKIEYIDLYPMSFEEFLLNYGHEMLYESFTVALKNRNSTSIIHAKLKELLKEYYIVGGMPEVVRFFLDNKNIKSYAFEGVRNKQKDLLSAYVDDFNKHSGDTAYVLSEKQFSPSASAKQNIPLYYAGKLMQLTLI